MHMGSHNEARQARGSPPLCHDDDDDDDLGTHNMNINMNMNMNMNMMMMMQGIPSPSTHPHRFFANHSSEHKINKDHPPAYDLGELEQPLSFTVSPHHSALHERRLGVTSRGPLDATIVPTPFRNSDRGEIQPSFDSSPSQKMSGRAGIEQFENSRQTDTSTDAEPNQEFDTKASEGSTLNDIKPADSALARNGDAKALRRLAQNREAARKSRLRKKAYVQQLENSRMKLNHMEQELQQARQQGAAMGGSYSMNQPSSNALAFNMDYARWLEEQNHFVMELRIGIHNHTGDNELRILVDSVMVHCEGLFRLKSVAAKEDAFHIISGTWKTPAERCFLWIGGYQPSAILKIIIPQIETLTEQQVLGICNLQQSSQQAEDALTQGMDTLLNSISESLCGEPSPSGHLTSYMTQMSMAMSKLATFESLIRQADLLRYQTIHQLQRILTTRQLARALLAIHDFFSRLRALSSLWLARPRD